MKLVHKFSVLIVDDDPLVTILLGNCLRAAGIEVSSVGSGAAALAAVAEHAPDLVSVDVEMAGMSGLELAQQLKARNVPFMFVSASAQQDVITCAKEYGAVGYLIKPFEASQILPAFTTALEVAQEMRRLRENSENLTVALNTGRETSMAIGIMMRSCQIGRQAAFEVLREYARANRRKITDVAVALLDAEELLSDLQRLGMQHRESEKRLFRS